MKIRWEVEDGYAGKSRPHYTEIPDEELEDMTDQEQEDFIEQWVSEEFAKKISFYWERV